MSIRQFLLATLVAAAGAVQAQPGVGAPPARNVPETFFGTEVADPYRWLEDTKNPEVAQWMKAASDQAAAVLARIPGRAAMLERLNRYEAAVAGRSYEVVRETGDRWFYLRRGAKEDQFKLVTRRGLGGADRVLVDPEAIAKKTGKPHAINYFSTSPGGRYVAYGLSAQGSEAAVLHVLDTATGLMEGQPIDRGDLASTSWSTNGKHMLFTRLQAMKPGMPETEKYQRSTALLLERGKGVGTARTVFGMGVAGVEMTPLETPVATFSHDGRWVFGYVVNGVQRELGLYVAPVAGVIGGRPQWKRLFTAADRITGVAYMRDMLYLRTHADAPRSKVLRAPIEGFDLAKAQVVVPAGERVITGIVAASDALYVEARDGNVKRLFRRGWDDDARLAEVKLPIAGSFELVGDEGGNGAANPLLPGVVFGLEGWTRARQIVQVRADGSVRNTGLQPKAPFDAPADVVATEVMVKSHDGAMVPMSILHKKGIALDGSHPTILYGYGSYGFTEDPYFSTGRLAWLDAGGVFAVANPRGTSVFGEDWYKAGFQATKPNTWLDFIACAEWLVAQKWTRPEKLGILGGSAGGILVGRAMTERPDLFAAVVPAVGALDMVRAEVTPNGVPNIPEFGTRATEPGFRALLAMSTYHQIKDGVKYPAVMLPHGVNDPRVEVWQSTKTAARLMAASASGKPILLRLDYDAGHGIGSTKAQQLAERADLYAFFGWQLGVAGFEPR